MFLEEFSKLQVPIWNIKICKNILATIVLFPVAVLLAAIKKNSY